MLGFQAVPVHADADVPACVDRERPDALLLDVYLGQQSGLEILERLRGSPHTKDLVVVMTSGMNVKAECMERGADAFLLKPYMPDELIQVLQAAIA
jgi:CheY-like chemotaxis protein